jgi:hypothetical protein
MITAVIAVASAEIPALTGGMQRAHQQHPGQH